MTENPKVQITLAIVALFLLFDLRIEATEVATDVLQSRAEQGVHGGRLVVAMAAEPKTFNPVMALDNPSLTILYHLHGDLLRIQRQTQAVEPALVRTWTMSSDGRVYQLELRRGVRFSDGEAFDADDVVFTFQVMQDPKVAPNAELLRVAGQPLEVRKLGSHSVEFRLAAPFSSGERLFDSVAILPEHLLAKAYREGRLSELWGVGVDVSSIAGLGPFQLASYEPGQQVVLRRNPHFWKVDSKDRRLPYLDELVFVFVPDDDAQLLRFQAGESGVLAGIKADGFDVLNRATARNKSLDLQDLGPGLLYEFLFFNLNEIDGEASPQLQRRQTWFREPKFRRAVSLAIDRESIARIVYRRRATAIGGHITPGNKLWYDPSIQPPTRSLEQARKLLVEAGFRFDDRGRLLDSSGVPVVFTLVTNSSNPQRVDAAAIVQEDLKRLGMEVNVVALEFRALLSRVLDNYDFDACMLGLGRGDSDPNSALNVWQSGGSNHLWRLNGPADPWQKRVDELLQRQMIETDPEKRRQQVSQFQQMVAEHLPFVFLVSPNVLVGARSDLGNFSPAILEPSALWNVDELYWQPPKP